MPHKADTVSIHLPSSPLHADLPLRWGIIIVFPGRANKPNDRFISPRFIEQSASLPPLRPVGSFASGRTIGPALVIALIVSVFYEVGTLATGMPIALAELTMHKINFSDCHLHPSPAR